MKARILLIASIVLLGIVALSGAALASTLTVNGIVTDSTGVNTVNGATVTLINPSGSTVATAVTGQPNYTAPSYGSGLYNFSVTATAGTYTITVSKNGFDTQSRTFTATGGDQVLEQDFLIYPYVRQTIAVYVATNASLWFFRTMDTYNGILLNTTVDGVLQSQTTGSNGAASFTGMRVGTTYTFTANGSGILDTSQQIQIIAGVTQYYVWVQPGNMNNPNPSASPVPAGTNYTGDLTRDITCQYNGSMNGNNGQLTINYLDSTHGTGTVTMTLYWMNKNSGQYEQNQTWSGSGYNVTHVFTITNASGQSYKCTVTAQNSYYGTITRTGSWDAPVNTTWNLGWPADIQQIMFIIVELSLAGIIARRHLIAGLWMMDVTGWFIWGIGMVGGSGMNAWEPVALAICLCLLIIKAGADWRNQHQV